MPALYFARKLSSHELCSASPHKSLDMPQILARPDNLNELNSRYSHQPLQHPVFLNSVPKCGTHLIRNIMRMFVAVDQHYQDTFIQFPTLSQHLTAFSTRAPKLSWGHLLFSDDSAVAVKHTRHTLMVRDPYTWVPARARFFLSDNFQGQMEHLKGGAVSVNEVLNLMIFGIIGKAPTIREIYQHNALAWLGTNARIIRMEDLVAAVKNLDSDQSEEFFTDLFDFYGVEKPADWRERVRVGADREQSGTARENLAGGTGVIPDELPDMQKRLVDHMLPDVRELLGYTD